MQPIPIRQAIILEEGKKHKSHHIVANFNGFIKAPWCAALQKTFVCTFMTWTISFAHCGHDVALYDGDKSSLGVLYFVYACIEI